MLERMRAKRAVSALVGEVWALEPNKLLQIADLAEALIEGRDTNGDMFARVAGESGVGQYEQDGKGVAVISVSGVIARRLNLFQAISGGCSTELLAKQIERAGNDQAVEAIILDCDSPGGGVFGLSALSEVIRTVRKTKPVVAWTGELMCSAAYWIGSAADEIVCSEDAQVGSVGVAAMHFDFSKRDEEEGVKRTVLFAGEYKRIASDEKPLSKEGREYLQERVDHYYSLFVEAVAENRGMSVEDVLEKLADGSTHIGNKALERGFVHHVGNMDFAVQRALALAEEKEPINSTQEADMPGTTQKGDGASGGSALDLSALTAEQLAQENPGLAAELTARGVNNERQRVVELHEAGGEPKATLQAVKDGVDPKDFYKQVLDDERKGKAQAIDDFEKDMADSAGQSGKETAVDDGADFDALVSARMEETKCSKGQAIRFVARKHPEVHAAWLNAQN